MSPDSVVSGPGAQVAAADPGQSVWVAANAGTGKTRVLIDRITRLLLQGTRPERILCLTFTKAAAAEMADRLHRRLGRWAVIDDAALRADLTDLLGRDPGDDLAPARRLFAESLDVPGGLKIQTIHAFCESLLSRFPLEAGVSPHFSVVEERTAAELLQEARDRTFEDAFAGRRPAVAEALEHIAGLVDEEQFDGVMRELLAARSRLFRLLDHYRGLDGLVAAGYRALGLGGGETDAGVVAEACAAGAYDETGLRRACTALGEGSEADAGRAASIQGWLDAPEVERRARWDAYAGVFLTKEGNPAKRIITKKASAFDPQAEDLLRAEQARVQGVAARRRAVAVAAATRALLTLGAALLDDYGAAKQGRALLDYDDLILKARDLLEAQGGVSWVLFKLDGGLDHILVDEAQDTSPAQWRIVDRLAEEFFAGEGARADENRTLFVVGDEKQSIYSFQGADPEGFERMRHVFADKAKAAGRRLVEVEMALSYRSTWTVLGLVDRVFEAGAARDGLTSAERAIRHQSSRDGQAGLVELWPTCTPEEEPELDPWDAPLDQLPARSPAARLAERIAATIQGWLESGAELESQGRPIRPGDIMVLVRTRGGFVEKMVRELKVRGIPVAGTDRMVLTDQLPVMDLMALGRFALLPEDDLNTATVLKGPLVGLDEEQLFRLAWDRPGSLWRALQEARDAEPAFARAHAVLEAARRRADYAPPFEFFARVLGRGEGRRRILERLGPEANDPVDEFLALALAFEREHVASLQGFLHWLEAGRAEVKRDLEHGRGEVRVMTVHGAKGLQAEVVFLPDTTTLPPASKDPRLRWRLDGDDPPVVLWPVRRDFEEDLSRELREKVRHAQEQEYRRLLYVAMTRAKDRLYVCGFEGKRGRDAGCWYDLVAAAMQDDANAVERPDGETVWRLTAPQTAPPPAEEPAAGTATPPPLPAWAFEPAPAEPDPPHPLTPSRPSEEDPPVRSPLAADDGARFRRGRLIHRLLQTLPELPPERREAAARGFLTRPGLGLTVAAVAETVAEVLAVLEHPEFGFVFGPGSRAEVPVVGTVGGQVISAQVDRLVVGPDRVTVVDYKTSRPPPTTPEAVPPAYLRQMAAYRAALRQVYPDRPVAALLVWTDGPLMMPLPEALLDARAP